MNVEEYERAGIARYEGLAQVVATILAAAIASDPSLRLQQIQHRAKAAASLKRKLERNGAKSDDHVEEFAKDLAGVRVVVYTNSDVTRLQSSSVIFGNFEVDWDRTKFHHPVSDVPTANELFESNNYVVRLKDGRAALPEYAQYAGLWCEVQVQTTLNHAWAETAHDTIYKKPKLSGFGGGLMDGIEERMKSIMRDYLVPAGYEFQKVLSDFERLSRGQELFERGVISTIEAAQNNNDLHDVLEKILDYVLPHYDSSSDIVDSLIDSVVAAVKRSNNCAVTPISTPFGDVAGRTSSSINSLAASILSKLRFANVERVFSAICELYLASAGSSDAEIWIRLSSEIAEPNLDVWQQAGPYVQSVIAAQLVGLPAERKSALRPLVLSTIGSALSPDIEGTTASSRSITIRHGAVVPSAALKDMRQKALDVLDELECLDEDELSRADFMQAYAVAMRFPHGNGHVDPSLAELIFHDARRIVDRYTARAVRWSYDNQQKLEHSLLWLYRHHGKKPEKAPTTVAAEDARDELVLAIYRARDALNKDGGYVIYKVLVGFDSVFPPAWVSASFDHVAEEAYRKRQSQGFIDEVDEESADTWREVIFRCARVESDDLATFLGFNEFLESLSERKPAIVLGYLDFDNDRFKNFLAPILKGLSRTTRWDVASGKLDEWISQGKFLSDIAFASGHVIAISSGALSRTLEVAIGLDDFPAIVNVIKSVSMRDRNGNTDGMKDVLLLAVGYMKARNEPRWVNVWLPSRQDSGVLGQMNEDEVSTILGSLVGKEQVDTRLEWFLADIAKTWPALVLSFFEARLLGGGVGSRHGAIPFSMPTLGPILAPHADLVMDAVRRWYGQQPDFFSYYGGKFVEGVYPKFSDELAQQLGKYIGDNLEDLRFVTAIARAYSGEAFLHQVLRGVVASTLDEQVLGSVRIALHPTGVTSGEFGRFERLKNVRSEVEAWLDDGRDAVQTFARQYLKQMDLEITAEKRRVDEELALRRLEYGEPLTGITGDDDTSVCPEASANSFGEGAA